MAIRVKPVRYEFIRLLPLSGVTLDGRHAYPKAFASFEGKTVDFDVLTKALIGRNRDWRFNPEALVEAVNQEIEVFNFAPSQLF